MIEHIGKDSSESEVNCQRLSIERVRSESEDVGRRGALNSAYPSVARDVLG